jgi:translation initiation factor 6
VFACTTEKHTFLPQNTSDEFLAVVRDVLGTEPVRVSLASSPLIGLFLLANRHGAVVPSIVYEDEIKALESYLPVHVIEGYTAIGNMASCNDHGCAASPLLSEQALGVIHSALKVKAEPVTVAGLDIPGSCISATDRGFLASSNASDEDLARISAVLGVPGSTGTLNYGNPFVRGGILATSNGAIVGTTTTPFELSRVDDALFAQR